MHGPPGRSGSPYPWLADEVWATWALGEPYEPVLADTEPVAVSDADRERAPRMPVDRAAPLPPAGDVEAQRARLLATERGMFLGRVVWPLCCERLATLVYSETGTIRFNELEAVAGPLDAALTDAGAADTLQPADHARRSWSALLADVRRGRHGGGGLLFWHCRACGRVYGGYCEE